MESYAPTSGTEQNLQGRLWEAILHYRIQVWEELNAGNDKAKGSASGRNVTMEAEINGEEVNGVVYSDGCREFFLAVSNNAGVFEKNY